jgi:hypothetical protein
MKHILKNIAALFAVMISMTVFSQNLAKDSIQVNKYLKEAGKVKAPAIFTIADAKKVAFISAYIDAKNKLSKDLQQKADAEYANQPGVRYRNGDQTAIPEIVAILNGADQDKITGLLSEMTYDVEGPHKLDSQIGNLLFYKLNDPETEETIVQFLGYNQIEGSRAAFEKRLYSGKSTDEDRILYWLTSSGSAPKTIDYVAGKYKSNPQYFDDKYWLSGTLLDYMEKASAVEKAQILEMAYDYMGRYKPAVADENTEATDSVAVEDHFQKFYAVALKYGKMDKMKPFMKTLTERYNENSDDEQISESDIEQALEILFIRDLDPKRQRELVMSMMATPDLFFEGLDSMQDVPALASNPEMIKKAFLLFQTATERSDTDRFVRSFSKMTPTEFAKYAAGVRSAPLRKELIDLHTINARTFDENVDYLISLGLADKKITDADIAAHKKANPYFEKGDSMYSAMDVSGISVSFDVETSEIPVSYDSLLNQFSKASHGKFGPFQSYVQLHYDDKKEMYDYRFMVIFNNKCFVMVPEDSGDWYDMTAFSKLLDALTAETEMTEQFTPIETNDQSSWYVFGAPAKTKQLIDTYKLAAKPDAEYQP